LHDWHERCFEGSPGRRSAVSVLELDKDNFERSVSATGIVLIDCWARWCPACKDFEPVFEEVGARNQKHTFARLDVQQEKELVERLGVEHVPTLVLYRVGVRLFHQPGYVNAEGLEDIVRQAESLDMDEVRAQLG
jgi:thioredoxin 1